MKMPWQESIGGMVSGGGSSPKSPTRASMEGYTLEVRLQAPCCRAQQPCSLRKSLAAMASAKLPCQQLLEVPCATYF